MRVDRACRAWRGLIGTRRGATSLLFAVSVVALLGLVALGSEVGNWYMAHRLGQNATDAAAIAGALAVARAENENTAVATAASDDGFVDGVGGVTVSITSPGRRSNFGAVKVTITQTIAPILTAMFGMGTINVVNQATALAQPYAVCGVSFGPLTLDGSGNFASSNCGLASNSSITASGSPAGVALVSASTCSGCSTPFFTYQPPVQNPYSDLDSASMSSLFTAASCNNVPAASGGIIELADPAHPSNAANVGVTMSPSNVVAYCDPGGLNTGSATSLVVHAGATYILSGMNINFAGGTVNCPDCWISPTVSNGTGPAGNAGVTFVLTGSYSGGFSAATTGTITISNTAIAMNAPEVSLTGSLFDGVLFYRDFGAGDAGCSVSIALTAGTVGGRSADMAGGMYFPTSCMSFAAPATTSTCSAIFANTLSFPGEAVLDDVDCGNVGATNPFLYATTITE